MAHTRGIAGIGVTPCRYGEFVESRWSVEMVESLAPSAAAMTAARPLATISRWTAPGCDERAVWGSCHGSGAEPYDTMVDHVGVGVRWSCPSRRTPCKHALALLLLWSWGNVPAAVRPPAVESWIDRRIASSAVPEKGASVGETVGDAGSGGSGAADESPTGADERGNSDDHAGIDDEATDVPEPPSDDERDTARDERVERMMAGLTELDRWLDDRMRTGLSLSLIHI